MLYAISTVNARDTGWSIYGTGTTEDEAMEDAIDHIGGRDVAKTTTEETLYRNLRFVQANELNRYGLQPQK